MAGPRLTVGALSEACEKATLAGYACLPVTVRIKKLDGTLVDVDTYSAEVHLNSGLLYIIAEEK